MENKHKMNDNQMEDQVFEFKRAPVVDNTIELAEPDPCFQPVRAGGFVLGYIDEVNGRGAGLERGFVPTRHEVLEIAHYWAKIATQIEYDLWCFDFGDATLSRRVGFAWRRLKRISECLGEEEVKRIIDLVHGELASRNDPRVWAAFLGNEDIPRDEHGVPNPDL